MFCPKTKRNGLLLIQSTHKLVYQQKAFEESTAVPQHVGSPVSLAPQSTAGAVPEASVDAGLQNLGNVSSSED